MSTNWKPPLSCLETGIKGLTLNDVTDETKAVMTKLEMDKSKVKPLIMPIYNSSTYGIENVSEFIDIIQGEHQGKTGYIYSRLGCPTTEEVECVVNVLEGGAGCLVVSSGMAALTTAMLAMLNAGDHVIAQNPAYSGVHHYLSKMAPALNIEHTWVPAGSNVDEYRKHIKANTKLIIGETPCNPMISILDLEEFGKIGAETCGRVYTMVDSTYASPYLQQPIKYGVDIVIHSATKYLGGHCDILGGVITMRTQELYTKINLYRTSLGCILSSFDAFLLARGIKTLHIRMERHSQNAEELARYLQNHPKVDKVFYPGLETHAGHKIAKKQMKMMGGMISFEMKGGLESAKVLVESVRVIQLAVSLGGVESLIEHPASMTHGPLFMNDQDRAEGFITDGLIRISVGLENVVDLVKDLEQALEKVN